MLLRYLYILLLCMCLWLCMALTPIEEKDPLLAVNNLRAIFFRSSRDLFPIVDLIPIACAFLLTVSLSLQGLLVPSREQAIWRDFSRQVSNPFIGGLVKTIIIMAPAASVAEILTN